MPHQKPATGETRRGFGRAALDGITVREEGPGLTRPSLPTPSLDNREYAGAFDRADLVTIRLPEAHDKVPADQQLDVPAIVGALRGRGTLATASSDVAELVRIVSGGVQRGDVILVMSNGSFGGFIPSLLSALRERGGG